MARRSSSRKSRSARAEADPAPRVYQRITPADLASDDDGAEDDPETGDAPASAEPAIAREAA